MKINYVTIDRRQQEMQEKFRGVPDEGIWVEYLGKKFIVYRNVFWPFEDSKPLVENYRINQEDTLLDVGTGSGVIAVFSAYKGAGSIMAVDINPQAVKNTDENARIHGLANVIEARVSDVFDRIEDSRQFDVITANLPFREKHASDWAQATQWDTEFKTNRNFFAGMDSYLKKKGRIYIAQCNYGNVREALWLASEAGYKAELIGKRKMHDGTMRVFYAFELTRK